MEKLLSIYTVYSRNYLLNQKWYQIHLYKIILIILVNFLNKQNLLIASLACLVLYVQSITAYQMAKCYFAVHAISF